MADYAHYENAPSVANGESKEEAPVSVQARGEVQEIRERASSEAKRLDLAAKEFARLANEALEAANSWRSLLAGDAPGMDPKSEY